MNINLKINVYEKKNRQETKVMQDEMGNRKLMYGLQGKKLMQANTSKYLQTFITSYDRCTADTKVKQHDPVKHFLRREYW